MNKTVELGRAWRRRGRLKLTAELTDETFLARFDDETRHWVVERSLTEWLEDLRALHDRSADFSGPAPRQQITADWASEPAYESDGTLFIDGQQVMQEWELPLMQRMVDRMAAPGSHVLEIGFGMGLSATMIQKAQVASHTIIEYNDAVLEQAERWRQQQRDPDSVHLVSGKWQDALPTLGRFDGVLFDTYPTSELEFVVASIDVPYPAEFFQAIGPHVTADGVVVYYTNEIDSLSRGHQRALLESFSSFCVEVVDGLAPPEDCNYWWASSMAVVAARGPREVVS